jgi:phage terminase small subunit
MKRPVAVKVSRDGAWSWGIGGVFHWPTSLKTQRHADHMVFALKKRRCTKMGPKMPSDLDPAARKKWKELVETCDPDVDPELLVNYCRLHANLVVIREERSRQQKAGAFKTMVSGRDGTEVLNPLLVHEGRLIASLNRMLPSLGLAPARDERKRRKPQPDDDEIDPLELALCGPIPYPPIPAPGPDASRADWAAYHAAHVQQQRERTDAQR